VDEVERHGETPRGRAFRLSEAKAEAVAAQFPSAIVIGGDQVPATSTTILNKPGNAANSREQLKLLSDPPPSSIRPAPCVASKPA
jgi:septum formation protein